MQNPRTEPALGVLADVRGRRWRLIDVRRFERCALVTLQGIDRGDLGETLRVLTPFDHAVTERRQPRIRLAGRVSVARHVADAVLASHPWRACWTAATANLTVLRWQLEPVLAVLGGATRVLLADAVGLGKTIQAGLILAELVARGLVDRALVLTPAGLRAQWADELATRFGLSPTILDQTALAREAASLPADVSPWAGSPIVISSIDLVKRVEIVTAVDRVPFDVLIVDEAHHLTPGSDRGAVVERLARRTPWVILITATPHSGDDQAFAYLSRLGSVGEDSLSVFRRRSPRHERETRTRLVAVRTSDTESALLNEVQSYAKAIWRDRGVTDAAARLVAIVLSRRAASSPEAVLATLLRRQRMLSDGPPEPAADATLPWEELDEADGDEAAGVLMAPGLQRMDEERGRIDRLIELAYRARSSAAKPAWIRRLLDRVREPVIVFSEYRDTIEALRARFAPLLPVATLHGGLSPAVRRAATAAFVNGPAILLLATDTGGEGLNLHARCRMVITNELPWNPLRLEQRIGRVDRIGQQRPVHAVHLMHAGSIEQTVLAHLHRRAARAAMSSSTTTAFDARVAEAVLGESPLPSLDPPEWSSTEVPLALDEVHRVEPLRRLAHLRRANGDLRGSSNTIPVAVPRRSRGPCPKATLLCAFQVTLADPSGRAVASMVVPVSIALVSPLPSASRALSAALRDVTNALATRDIVTATADSALQSTRETTRDFANAIGTRVAALSAAWTVEGRQLYQPALFDDRSSGLAAERSAVQEIHRRHLERVERVVRGFDTLTMVDPVLIGAWLES